VTSEVVIASVSARRSESFCFLGQRRATSSSHHHLRPSVLSHADPLYPRRLVTVGRTRRQLEVLADQRDSSQIGAGRDRRIGAT
jgi:hypothetical protein